MINRKALVFVFIALAIIVFISQTSNVFADNTLSQNRCKTKNYQWAVTLDGAWLSTNTNGDWKTDVWFYLIAPNTNVIAQIDDGKYYLICYEFSSTQDPLFGWIEKTKIILHSDVTPEGK